MGRLLPPEQGTDEQLEEEGEAEHEADHDQEDDPVSPAQAAQGAPVVRTGGAGVSVSVTHHGQSSVECSPELTGPKSLLYSILWKKLREE